MEPSDLANLYASLDRNVESLYVEAPSSESEEQTCDAGRYDLAERLGSGGLKSVYLAFDRSLEHHLAFATLDADRDDPASAADFMREARLTASLSHPNVIRVYDIGSREDGRPYFTMSLLPGRSLADEIGAGAPRDRRLLDCLAKICDAIAYAHDSGVVHLDLKPENIQIGRFGEVLVCDWGIARYLTDDAANPLRLPVTDLTVSGTPAYMAPEQARGEPLDERTDVYALGAILYAILTGVPPRGRDSGRLTTVTAAAEAAPIPSPDEVDPHVPAALAAICRKAMQPTPTQRYESATAFRDDLLRYLNGYATRAEDPSLWRLASLVIVRHRQLAAASVVFAALLAIASAVFVSGLRSSRDAALDAEAAATAALTRAIDAERLALEERDEAEAQTERAESLLAAYEAERAETLRLAGVVEDMRQLSARAAFLDHRFDDASAIYAELAEKHPNSQIIANEKAVVHLVRQEFHAAAEAFARADDPRNKPLAAAAQYLSKQRPRDDMPLSPELSAVLLRRIPPVRTGIRMRAFVFATSRLSPEECLPIVRTMIGNQVTFTLSPGESGPHLRIDTCERNYIGSMIWEADYPRAVSVFAALQPASIDLSQITIGHVDDLRYLPTLRSVILPRNRVGLRPLVESSNAIALTIPPNVYSPAQLEKLPKQIQVTVNPDPYPVEPK